MVEGVGAATTQRLGRYQKTKAGCEKEAEYELDVTVDSEWYQSFCIDDLILLIMLKFATAEDKIHHGTTGRHQSSQSAEYSRSAKQYTSVGVVGHSADHTASAVAESQHERFEVFRVAEI